MKVILAWTIFAAALVASMLVGQIVTNAEYEQIVRVQTSPRSSTRAEIIESVATLRRLQFYRSTAFAPWVTPLVDHFEPIYE
jgi:hypothetical protein